MAGKSLKMTTRTHFMRKKKLVPFDWEEHQNSGYSQWMLSVPYSGKLCHLSSEWLLSGTPETLEYHEALGKDIHFCKDSLRDKTVHFSFMELNTYSWRDSVCYSKWLQGFNQISTNQWTANWTRNITHKHKHKQLYKHKKVTISYLLSSAGT
jgi:hypothetical protein